MDMQIREILNAIDVLLEEKAKGARGQPFDRWMVSLLDIIVLDVGVGNVDRVYLGITEKVDMMLVTQKQLYEDAILLKPIRRIMRLRRNG